MNEFSDAELLAMLGGALSPTPAAPDAVTLARLHMTLADISTEVGPLVTARAHPSRTLGGLRRRMAQHVSVVAVAAAVILTGGVATAGVATDTLPGPTRNIAYDLGLPVTSPGLFQARQNMDQLKRSIVQGNRQEQIRWGSQLQHDLKSLNDDDLAQIRVPALSVLNEAGLEDPLQSPGTTSTTSPATKNGSGSDHHSPDHDSSDVNPSGSNLLIPTLTVPSFTDPVPITAPNDDGSGEFLPTTPSSSNSDQVTTTVTIPPVSG